LEESVMRIEVVTLFPAMVEEAARYGVTGRALERGLWSLACRNPRDFASDAYRSVDDRPYGGGQGMVMLAEPLEQAIAAARSALELGGVVPLVICMTPSGEPLRHERVKSLARAGTLLIVAGRYEAIDERVIERCVDLEVSVGDFVVSGGELPALLLIDAVVRHLPGVLNDERSSADESFADGLLEGPQYTRPECYADAAVPPVLLSGDHAAIARWRRKQALARTWQRRPDLLAGLTLNEEDARLLAECKSERHAK
jgi:tRNA (guanine37-N1)-methyltransferase